MVWSTFLWRLFKWLRQTWEGHEHLCLQVAELDAYAGGIRMDRDRLEIETETITMRQNMIELEQAQEMVSDGADAIHYAVVEMGGYVRMSELSADQRRHMYTHERKHGCSKCHGSAAIPSNHSTTTSWILIGQNTDVRTDEGEQAESENDSAADDPMVATENEGPWTPLINLLRDEINNALRRENFRDASELQRMVLIILDNLNAGNLRVDATRNSILQEIANRLESMVLRHRALLPAVAERYNGYAVTVRRLMVTRNGT